MHCNDLPKLWDPALASEIQLTRQGLEYKCLTTKEHFTEQ